jgi:hypothetical protein
MTSFETQSVASAHHSEMRSSSLMEVLARVWASTRFTMTAQYSPNSPSAEGECARNDHRACGNSSLHNLRRRAVVDSGSACKPVTMRARKNQYRRCATYPARIKSSQWLVGARIALSQHSVRHATSSDVCRTKLGYPLLLNVGIRHAMMRDAAGSSRSYRGIANRRRLLTANSVCASTVYA